MICYLHGMLRTRRGCSDALLVAGEIQGERVAPDIASKAKNVD
jgi:hypothetical protein